MLLVDHGVWLRRQLVRNMAREFSKIRRAGTVKLDRERFKSLVVMFADHEMTPLEIANLHIDNMNPLTGLKIRVLYGQWTFYIVNRNFLFITNTLIIVYVYFQVQQM
jgi:hypothetical protein